MDSKSSEGEPENLPDAQDLFADLEKQSLGSSTKSVNLLHQKKTLNPRDWDNSVIENQTMGEPEKKPASV